MLMIFFGIVYRMNKQQGPTVKHYGSINHNGKRIRMYLYITESFCCVSEIDTIL